MEEEKSQGCGLFTRLKNCSFFKKERHCFPPLEYAGFTHAVGAGYTHMLPWFERNINPRMLQSMFNIFYDEYQQIGGLSWALYDAVKNGHLEMIKQVAAHQSVYDGSSPESKAMRQVDFLATLFDYHLIFVAAEAGQLPVLVWLKESMSPEEFQSAMETKAPVILRDVKPLQENVKLWLEEQVALFPSQQQLQRHDNPFLGGFLL